MGQENAGCTINDSFFLGTHGAILMFDVGRRDSYKNIPEWYRQLVRCCENIPIVLVGNKIDCKDRKVRPKHITFHRKKNLMYYDVSALASFRIDKPYLWIMRKLVGDANLAILSHPQLKPC